MSINLKVTIILLAFIIIISMVFLFDFGNNNNGGDLSDITGITQSKQNKDAKELYSQLVNREDLSQAIFAGGCFWCMEGPFEQIDGVEEVISGYTGGQVQDPTYEQIGTGRTGHREAVVVFYDPTKVDYEDLLKTFWWQIDPTDPGGQFADRGEQYKTAIYYINEDQRVAAETSKSALNSSGKYSNPVVTDILPASDFYPAEDYHQDYYKKSAERYELYKKGSGREDFIKKNKANEP